jgi:hypothetical protein
MPRFVCRCRHCGNLSYIEAPDRKAAEHVLATNDFCPIGNHRVASLKEAYEIVGWSNEFPQDGSQPAAGQGS